MYLDKISAISALTFSVVFSGRCLEIGSRYFFISSIDSFKDFSGKSKFGAVIHIRFKVLEKLKGHLAEQIVIIHGLPQRHAGAGRGNKTPGHHYGHSIRFL